MVSGMIFPSQRIIQSLPIRPRKRLGQHFLVHKQTAQNIVAACNITQRDTVIEIGAGCGALTAFLAEVAGAVIAVEIDPQLVNFLRHQAAAHRAVRVITADMLHLPIPSLLESSTKAVVVGNIPYGITTPLFLKLLEELDCIHHAVCMVQKDMRSRIQAQPGENAYGLLSMYMQAYTTIAFLFNVPASSFYPRPLVDSSVLMIKPVPGKSWHDPREKLFRELAAAALAMRRKTIYNCLKKLAACWALPESQIHAVLRDAGIAAQRRGETLSVQEFYCLADALAKLTNSSRGHQKSAL